MSIKISNTKTPQEVLQLRLQAAFAEYNAAVSSERIKLGIRKRRTRQNGVTQ